MTKRRAWLTLGDAPPQSASPPLGRGLAVSLLVHAAGALALLLWLNAPPERATLGSDSPQTRIVYLQAPGPSGGAGGAPAARPAPRPPAAEPAAVRTPPPVSVPIAPPPQAPPTPPAPTLASMLTVSADTPLPFQGAPVTISGPGGPGGRGVGDTPGLGAGDGAPGPGANDGPAGPGSGLSDPLVLRKVSPEYSGHAMVAKIEGTVGLEVEIETNGTVGKARVTKSLDPGLDEEAIKAALQWRFIPAKRNGRPVATLVTLLLDFHLR